MTAVEHNHSDLMPGFIPPDRIEELRTRYAEQLHVNTGAQFSMMFLNVRTPPFDRLGVRRALAYATDHDETIRLGLGRDQALTTCQILPPNFPGYRPYCPYTLHPSRSGTWTAPNLRKAKRLIKSSHTRGMKITVWTWRDKSGVTAPSRVACYFAALLNRLGYDASLKIVSGAGRYFSTVADSRTRAQIGFSSWAADYPAASAFINSLLSCQTFRPGTPEQTNFSEFCDRRIDAKIKHGLRVQADDPAAAGTLWSQIDRDLVDEAPLVPLNTPKVLGFVSRRVGNYQYNPQWGVLLSQLWVR